MPSEFNSITCCKGLGAPTVLGTVKGTGLRETQELSPQSRYLSKYRKSSWGAAGGIKHQGEASSSGDKQ